MTAADAAAAAMGASNPMEFIFNSLSGGNTNGGAGRGERSRSMLERERSRPMFETVTRSNGRGGDGETCTDAEAHPSIMASLSHSSSSSHPRPSSSIPPPSSYRRECFETWRAAAVAALDNDADDDIDEAAFNSLRGPTTTSTPTTTMGGTARVTAGSSMDRMLQMVERAESSVDRALRDCLNSSTSVFSSSNKEGGEDRHPHEEEGGEDDDSEDDAIRITRTWRSDRSSKRTEPEAKRRAFMADAANFPQGQVEGVPSTAASAATPLLDFSSRVYHEGSRENHDHDVDNVDVDVESGCFASAAARVVGNTSSPSACARIVDCDDEDDQHILFSATPNVDLDDRKPSARASSASRKKEHESHEDGTDRKRPAAKAHSVDIEDVDVYAVDTDDEDAGENGKKSISVLADDDTTKDEKKDDRDERCCICLEIPSRDDLASIKC